MHPTHSLRGLVVVFEAIALMFVSSPTRAAEYYVAPSGNDSNPGTMARPFATLQKGHDTAIAGDTVWIRGGTYQVVTPKTANAGIALTKSGTSDANRIKFWAFPGERPVFDFAMLKIATTTYTSGFSVSGSFLHIKGLEIENVPMNTISNNGMGASGSNNIFELIEFHHNNGTGLFINGGMGGNLILNCDSHDNYDPTSFQGDGQNADGFGVHYQTSGSTTTVRGCRAWWNSDDGYDLINQEVPVVIEGSWAMGNGYIKSGTARPAAGNGNGFKAGSSKTGVRHVVRNCLAWGNVANGFYANHSSGGNDWFNNTSYRNGTQYNMLASDPNDASVTIILMGDKIHRMRNNLGYPDRNSNMMGVDTASNSWDLSLTPTDADFASVSDAGTKGPREPDGSMPNASFMKLSAGSRFIDKGANVGLPFAGTAPDLGCFETGLPNSGATSAGGTGGSAGAGGAGNSGQSGGSAAGGTPGAMSASGGDAGRPVTGGSAGAGAGGASPGGGAPSRSGTASGGSADGGASAAYADTGGAPGALPPAGNATAAASGAAGCDCSTGGHRKDAHGTSSGVLLLAALYAVRGRRRGFERRAMSTRAARTRATWPAKNGCAPASATPPMLTTVKGGKCGSRFAIPRPRARRSSVGPSSGNAHGERFERAPSVAILLTQNPAMGSAHSTRRYCAGLFASG